jgi:hypothetical protein
MNASYVDSLMKVSAHILRDASGQGALADTPDIAFRLAACWNAFEGVPTDKIVGKSVDEYVCGEAYLEGMNPSGGSLHMGLTGTACQMLAESFAGQFVGSGATNFVEVAMSHKELGPFTVTIQRTHGETPAQQKAAALARLDNALTLLSDALETFDDIPHQDHEVADRIRAFLAKERDNG